MLSIFFFLAGRVKCSLSDHFSCKPVIQIHGGLGGAQPQKRVTGKHAAELSQYLLLSLHIKINENVAAQNQIEWPQSFHTLSKVERLELHQLADVTLHLPFEPGTLKVLHQILGRQPAI